MLDFKEILLDRALKKNKKICLPEDIKKLIKVKKSKVLFFGKNIYYH